MSRVGLGHIAVVAGALALAACSTTRMIIVNESPEPQNYRQGDLSLATKGGEMLAQIDGNPFNMPDDQFASEALDEVNAAYRGMGPPAKIVTKASPKTNAHYKFVYVFDPARSLDPQTVCEAKAPFAKAPKGKTVVVLGVFCGGSEALTDATARVSGIDSPRDPAFQKLLAATTSALLPAMDQSEFGNGDSIK